MNRKNGISMVLFLIGCCIQSICAMDGLAENMDLESVTVFADVLTKEDPEIRIAHVRMPEYNEPMRQNVYAEMTQGMNMTTNELKSLMSESDIRLYQVKEVIRGDLSECIFIFQNRRVFNINGDNFNLFMALGSEWLLIVYPALSTEGKVEAKFLSQDYVDRMPILSRHNLFQLYKKGKGSICLLKGSPSPFSKMQKEEAPAKIIPDIKEIQAAILGGDTNVIRALEGKMKGDFGKALAREIARRLLPPSFEEQMRLDIAELRRAQWRGKSISMKEAVTRMQDCETQLRSAYESGEIDRETYVELMGKLGLDVNKYPNRHLPGPRTKAPTNAAEVH